MADAIWGERHTLNVCLPLSAACVASPEQEAGYCRCAIPRHRIDTLLEGRRRTPHAACRAAPERGACGEQPSRAWFSFDEASSVTVRGHPVALRRAAPCSSRLGPRPPYTETQALAQVSPAHLRAWHLALAGSAAPVRFCQDDSRRDCPGRAYSAAGPTRRRLGAVTLWLVSQWWVWWRRAACRTAN